MRGTWEETLVTSRLASTHKSGSRKSLMALYIVFSTLLGIRPLKQPSLQRKSEPPERRVQAVVPPCRMDRAQWIGHPLYVPLILRERKRDGGQGERNRNEV